MIKTWIDKFHRDDETAEDVGDSAMRLDIGAKFITAEKRVAPEKRIAFAFKIKFFR